MACVRVEPETEWSTNSSSRGHAPERRPTSLDAALRFAGGLATDLATMTNVDRIVMWAATAWPGVEHLEIRETADGVAIDGLVVAHVDGEPVRLHYSIRCDADWVTRRLEVRRLRDGPGLLFESDGMGGWTDGSGAELPELAGCIDVDITVTPFTNTLPIRRLGWRAGQARDLLMVYVLVPEMTIQPARQRYTCLERGADGSVFRYESGTFRRDLRIDPDGLVMDYPGFWRRIAT